MKKLSFRMRITVFAGIIVLITALSLALLSMYNAHRQLSIVSESMMSESIPSPYEAANEQDINSYTLSEPIPNGVVVEPNTNSYSISDGAVIVAQSKRQFNYANILYTVVIAIVGMIAAYIFAGSALKPIRRLNNMITNITEKNLDCRLPEYSANDEISSITSSFNAMLDRLSDSFVRQKRFSSNAAHELKTPVAIIKSSLQTLKLNDNLEANDYEETFAIISRNTERLADIIDDLLTLTNEEAELPSEVISLNAMLVMIVRDLTPQYRKRDIEVKYEFQSEECFIECAEMLTYRLFYNLIENSFKYNKQGGKLTIGITEDVENYQIHIKDTGIGIPQAKLPYVWEAFYCADPSRSKKMGGAGLGLSVVREIANRFGWTVTVDSQEGIYTEFVVNCKKVNGVEE